ncbi:MAG: sigma-70 family RNA polymerase sigma factor [Pedosphaera sp.]|nr:sigma-70 family RNA polymerase sigma factor [Pedosphaera sp.]
MPAERNPEWCASKAGPRDFATTHWSVVVAAGQLDSQIAAQALEKLCQTYWYPLYAYARRHGRAPEDAQDLVQGFFAQLLERRSYRERTPGQGRFRSFLLASFNYYIADQRDRERAAKRGGNAPPPLALDALSAEERYRFEPVDRLTPEKIFERRWALTLVDNVLASLEREFSDRPDLFRHLRPLLFDKSGEASLEQVATASSMNAGAVRVALHRIRQRCRELFREEVAHTVERAEEIEDELRYLRALLGG